MSRPPSLGRTRLADAEVLAELPPGWSLDGGRIWREWTFEQYLDGVNFALAVARQAETMDHHPDLHIFYRLVRVAFWTHDMGGVTRVDLRAARAVNALLTA
ncbi:4a-hydroxytetrahydrobiopterin dehydratase [Deinococcus fonticola]|uniref:4a-hydroxytetrahydrobiopterin dehydratase n=1 Tax=Deinococcus fonticola TaxID=2528713 RepID=UPI001074B28B|nr:4a-hydroxytetrahydrobiopterin dehydratase [Deinococcus fonticola]